MVVIVELNDDHYEIIPTFNEGPVNDFSRIPGKKLISPIDVDETIFAKAIEDAFLLCEPK